MTLVKSNSTECIKIYLEHIHVEFILKLREKFIWQMESQRYVHIVSMNFCLRTISRKICRIQRGFYKPVLIGLFSLFTFSITTRRHIRVNSSFIFFSFSSLRHNMQKNSQSYHIGRRCKRQRHFLTGIEQWTTTSASQSALVNSPLISRAYPRLAALSTSANARTTTANAIPMLILE